MAGYNDLERERAIKCVLLDIQNSLRRKTQTKRYNGKPAQIQRLEALIEKDDLTIKSPGKGLHKPTAEQLRNILKDTFGGVKIFTSLDHLTSEERQKWLKKPKKGLQSPRAQNTQPPARPSRGTVKPVGTYAEDAFEGEDPILESTKPNTPQNVDSTARPAAKLFLKRSLNHVASASTSSKREQSVMIQESGVSSRAAEPLVPITTLSADTHTNVGSEPVQIEAKATRVVEQSPETSRTAEIEESSPLSPPHLDVMGASPSNAKRGASEALGEPDGLEANKRVKVAAQEDRLGNLDAAGNDYMKLVQHNLAPEDTAVSKQEIDIETTGQAEMLEAKSSDRVNEKAPAQQQLDMAPGDPGAESNSQSYPEHLRYAQNIGVQVELLVSRIRNAATTISEEIKASNTRARFLGTPGAELEGLYTRILTTDGGNWKEGAVPVLAAGSRIEHLLSACIGAALFDEVFTKPVPWQTPQDISHELRDAIPIADALLKWLRAGRTFEYLLYQMSADRLEEWGTFDNERVQPIARELAQDLFMALIPQLMHVAPKLKISITLRDYMMRQLTVIFSKALFLRARLEAAPVNYRYFWATTGQTFDDRQMEEVTDNEYESVGVCIFPGFFEELADLRTGIVDWKVTSKAQVHGM